MERRRLNEVYCIDETGERVPGPFALIPVSTCCYPLKIVIFVIILVIVFAPLEYKYQVCRQLIDWLVFNANSINISAISWH